MNSSLASIVGRCYGGNNRMDANSLASSASDAARELGVLQIKTSHPSQTVKQRVGNTIYVGICLGAFWLGWLFVDASYRGKSTRDEVYIVGQLTMALRMYHEEQGAFPPTRYQPVPGGPVHSWRVLMVPYTVGGEGYDFSQEWNSPHNLRVWGGERPGRFFGTKEDGRNITPVLAVGEDDEWPSAKPLRAYVEKQGGDRFLLVEHPESQIHWMEPKY